MKHLMIALLLAVCFAHPLPMNAQQSTSDDELDALIERLSALIETAQTYTSFTSNVNNITERGSLISVPDLDYEVDSATNVYYSAVRDLIFDADDGTPVNAGVLSVIDVFEVVDEFTDGYQLIAETRLVDGTVYLRTAIDSEEMNAALELGEDWRLIDDPVQIAELAVSEFNNTFAVDGVTTLTWLALVDSIDLANSITLGEAILQEETYETVTFSYTGADFLTFSEQVVDLQLAGNVLGEIIAAQVSVQDDEVFSFTLFINADGQIAGNELEMRLEVVIDGADVGPELAGGTVTSSTFMLQQEILTGINVPLEPVNAPEMP
ncbi:MAG: hypothetical protein EA396_02410 [Anaerolineaceae bacterium]|nr:MAG: hypothetical protein EA396_02410 [Anaerolineaceae bacterium]